MQLIGPLGEVAQMSQLVAPEKPVNDMPAGNASDSVKLVAVLGPLLVVTTV